MIPAANVFRPPLSRTYVTWAGFVVALVGVLVVKVSFDRWYGAREAEWNRYVDRVEEDRSRLHRGLIGRRLYGQPHFSSSFASMDQALAELAPRVARWQHLDAGSARCVVDGVRLDSRVSNGWVITLTFRDAKLERIGLQPPAGPDRPPSPSARKWGRTIAPALVFLGAVAWVGGLLSAITEPRRAEAFGQVALAGAMTCIVGWAVMGAMDGALSRPATMGGVYVGAAMAFAALGAPPGLFRRVHSAGAETVCRTCRYDLTGNLSGVCPECGTETLRRSRSLRDHQIDTLARNLAVAAGPEVSIHGDEDCCG